MTFYVIIYTSKLLYVFLHTFEYIVHFAGYDIKTTLHVIR